MATQNLNVRIKIEKGSLPKIILFGGEKGGSGKSSLAENLAVVVAHLGVDVILVDTDAQNTCKNWVERRNARIERGRDIPPIHCVQCTGNVRKAILDLATRYECVIVDAGGRDSEELRTAMTAANKMLIPLTPSQNDLETVEHVYSLVRLAKDFNQELSASIVLNKASTHAAKTEIKDAVLFLDEYEDLLPLSKTIVCERKIFRDVSAKGLGVIEDDNDKAFEEIVNLAKEVIQHESIPETAET